MKINTMNIVKFKSLAAWIHGTGECILFLHGIPGSSLIWEAVVDRLNSGYQVIIPDLIGFGMSKRAKSIDELWTDSQADAILSLLDEQGIKKFHVVAHDFGGPVVSALYTKASERFNSLTLISSNLFGDTPVPLPLSLVLSPIIGGLMSHLLFSSASLAMMVKTGMGNPKPEKIDTKKYVGDKHQVEAIRIIFSSALRELASRYLPVTKALKNISVKSQVLWGDKDPFFTVDQGLKSAVLLGTSRFICLKGAGHFLPEERPEEVTKAIQELIN
jgi:pimeloyl-ACP methyl ester carboxylesterase